MKTKITKTFNQGEYEQIIKFLMESKTIYFIDCTCPDFVHRRMHKNGQVADIKVFANCCKHLKPIIEYYEKIEGFKLKRPKPMQGTDKCTAELRRFLIERSGGGCEMYNCGRLGVEVHRKILKVNCGKYNKSNCVLLCSACHKIITYQKWQSSPGAKK